MRHYEIVVIARSEQKERSEAMTQRHQKIIVDGGGGVHRFEDWGVRPLAYPINKQLNARYFLYNVECEQNTLNELKESLRFSESIIRYMVVRCDKAETEESPMLKRIRNEAEKAKEEAAAAAAAPSGRGRGERGERGERRTSRFAAETGTSAAATATAETPAAVESETSAATEAETSAAVESETSAATESEPPAATESAIEESPSGEETASAVDTAGEAKETKPDTDDSAPETPETPETPEGTEDEKTK